MTDRSPRPLPAGDVADVVDATASLWHEVRGEQIFFTGGTGFIGSWMLETFLAACERFDLRSSAMVLTRDASRFHARLPHVAGHDLIRIIQGGVRSFELPQGTFRFIFHGAAEASAQLNDTRPDDMRSTIVDGTRRTLAFAEKCDAQKILFVSSGAVYGVQPSEVEHVDESFEPVNCPPSAYAEGKREAEELCGGWRGGAEVKIARGFAFVGPRLPLDIHFAIGNFLRDALDRRPIHVRGDGTPMRSYLYASDLAVWLWTILFRGIALRPYNVGSEEALSISQIAERVASAVKPQLPVVIDEAPDTTRLPARYVPSTRRARGELGVEPSVGLDDAIHRTLEWNRR
jgi:nucleoside-diphosphate-sugar epimerase